MPVIQESVSAECRVRREGTPAVTQTHCVNNRGEGDKHRRQGDLSPVIRSHHKYRSAVHLVTRGTNITCPECCSV